MTNLKNLILENSSKYFDDLLQVSDRCPLGYLFLHMLKAGFLMTQLIYVLLISIMESSL